MARTTSSIDLNSDLGEGYGPWRMGDDAAILRVVTSANIACGGHAGDPDTMVDTLTLAGEAGVAAGAHPGFADREGFGRRLIPMTAREVERLVATQIGALAGAAALAGTPLRYVKPHGALANWVADEPDAARAVVSAIRAISRDLAVLAISGTVLEREARAAGLSVFSEIFADRGYLANGRLVPRRHEQAMIHDADVAAERLVAFLQDGMMPTVDGAAVALDAHSICVHGDSAGALAMAVTIRGALEESGFDVEPFLKAP